jgi:tRNA(His) 5'-end guanylyltransferase
MARTTEQWDEEKAYDERIFPLMAQIIAICKERRIPMIASFAYANDDEVHHCTTALPFEGRTVDVFESSRQLIYRGFTAFMVTTRPASEATTKGGDAKGDGT